MQVSTIKFKTIERIKVLMTVPSCVWGLSNFIIFVVVANKASDFYKLNFPDKAIALGAKPKSQTSRTN